jgi:hypothetical protein
MICPKAHCSKQLQPTSSMLSKVQYESLLLGCPAVIAMVASVLTACLGMLVQVAH